MLRTSKSNVSFATIPPPTDPVPEYVFRRFLRTHQGSGGNATSFLRRSISAKHTLAKSEELEFLLEEPRVLNVELGMNVVATISEGNAEKKCSARTRAEAHAATEDMARSILDHTNLARYGSSLVVSTSLARPDGAKSDCSLDLTTPPTCGVNLLGCFCNVEIVGLTGTVSASLPYGGVTLFNTTGKVRVETGSEGRIVFVGGRGDVRLKSGGEIDLKIVDQTFAGSLIAEVASYPSAFCCQRALYRVSKLRPLRSSAGPTLRREWNELSGTGEWCCGTAQVNRRSNCIHLVGRLSSTMRRTRPCDRPSRVRCLTLEGPVS